jgi:hypothetical protein
LDGKNALPELSGIGFGADFDVLWFCTGFPNYYSGTTEKATISAC